MALNRPAVLVYQEFATLSVTPTTPELNVCVVGPCYQILDYPEDLAQETLPTFGTANTAASGAALSTSAAVITIPAVRTAAVVDTASLKVTLVAPIVEVLAGACTSTASSPNITLTAVDAVAAGVVAGDTLVISNAGGTVTVRNLVRSVTSATVVVMNNQADATVYTKFRIERTVADAVVATSAVSSTTVTLPANLAVSGKTVVYSTMFIGYRALRTDLADVTSYDSEDSIKAALGKYDARNPLCVGAVVARRNTSSTVQAYGITTNDDAGYGTMMARTSSRKDLYAVVPLTQSISVLSSFKTEFASISDPDYVIANGLAQKFRVVIGQPGSLPADKIIVDTNLDGVVAAGAVSPAANTVVTLVTYLGDLTTLGILPGYKMLASADAFVTTAASYTVASVLSATTLTVDGVAVANVGTSVKFQTAAGVDVASSLDSSASWTVGAATATFTKLTDPNGTFVDAGVLPGDYIEIPADPTATTFTGTLLRLKVGVVDSNQSLNLDASLGRDTSLVANELPHGFSRVLVGGVLVAVDAAHTYRIVRALDADGQVTALIAAGPGSLNHRRAWVCWPDAVDVSDLVDGSLSRATLATATPSAAATQPGYYLACAVGGLVAALPSHHGLTRMGVAGIKKTYNSNTYFTDKQLTKLSNNGWMVFQQDTPTALPYIIHGLTSDVSALQFGEAMMVKNLDYCSMVFSDSMEPFIGTWNINKETIGFISSALNNSGDSLRLDKKPKIGARLKSMKITQLAESTISADRLEARLECDFPKPLNTVALHIVSL